MWIRSQDKELKEKYDELFKLVYNKMGGINGTNRN